MDWSSYTNAHLTSGVPNLAKALGIRNEDVPTMLSNAFEAAEVTIGADRKCHVDFSPKWPWESDHPSVTGGEPHDVFVSNGEAHILFQTDSRTKGPHTFIEVME